MGDVFPQILRGREDAGDSRGAVHRVHPTHPTGLLRLRWSHDPQMQWFPHKFTALNSTPLTLDGAQRRRARHPGGERPGLARRSQVSHRPECCSVLLCADARRGLSPTLVTLPSCPKLSLDPRGRGRYPQTSQKRLLPSARFPEHPPPPAASSVSAGCA